MQETYSSKGSKGKSVFRRPNPSHCHNGGLTCGNTDFVEGRECPLSVSLAVLTLGTAGSTDRGLAF